MLTASLTTLDGLAEGTDVAIVTGSNVQRWQVASGGGLTRDTHRLEPFFLTGLLSAGRVVHGDFSPAQPREWFTRSRLLLLVLEAKNESTTECAVFRNGAFHSWSTEEQLVEHGHRVPAPEWAGIGATFHEMTLMAWNTEKRAQQWRERVRKCESASNYIRYVIDYANNAKEMLDP